MVQQLNQDPEKFSYEELIERISSFSFAGEDMGDGQKIDDVEFEVQEEEEGGKGQK